MDRESIIKELRKLCSKERNINYLCDKLKLNEYEILDVVRELRSKGINIITKVYDDNLYLYDNGERENKCDYKYNLTTDENHEIKFVAISDTRFGSVYQQLSILNDIYADAYENGYNNVMHCGNISEGIYSISNVYNDTVFLDDTLRQVEYIARYYPKVEGMKTYFITSTKDESHYKNGQGTVNEWVSRCRNDMIYLGQDTGEIKINGVKIVMDHPGGGSASALSYKPQKRIEILEAGSKPKILLIGHYHKSYSFVYRNVRGIEVPALCDKTQFQQKQGLINYVGAYFLDIYSDKKGNIQYFMADEVLYDSKDMWDEAGRDRNKVRQLVIK